jgi:hypothetical protein
MGGGEVGHRTSSRTLPCGGLNDPAMVEAVGDSNRHGREGKRGGGRSTPPPPATDIGSRDPPAPGGWRWTQWCLCRYGLGPPCGGPKARCRRPRAAPGGPGSPVSPSPRLRCEGLVVFAGQVDDRRSGRYVAQVTPFASSSPFAHPRGRAISALHALRSPPCPRRSSVPLALCAPLVTRYWIASSLAPLAMICPCRPPGYADDRFFVSSTAREGSACGSSMPSWIRWALAAAASRPPAHCKPP